VQQICVDRDKRENADYDRIVCENSGDGIHNWFEGETGAERQRATVQGGFIKGIMRKVGGEGTLSIKPLPPI
jgi:hypothetical protein